MARLNGMGRHVDTASMEAPTERIPGGRRLGCVCHAAEQRDPAVKDAVTWEFGTDTVRMMSVWCRLTSV